jgi:hypothetical protein
LIKTKRPASTVKMIMETTSEAAKALALCPANLLTFAFVVLLVSTGSKVDIFVFGCMLCEADPTWVGAIEKQSATVSICRHGNHHRVYTFLRSLCSCHSKRREMTIPSSPTPAVWNVQRVLLQRQESCFDTAGSGVAVVKQSADSGWERL